MGIRRKAKEGIEKSIVRSKKVKESTLKYCFVKENRIYFKHKKKLHHGAGFSTFKLKALF